MKIAFQGVKGAYGHQACIEKYPEATILPCPNFEATIDAVRNGEADLAMLPIENSTYGRVSDVHHLLPEAGLYIVGEHFVRVRIHWFARPDQDVSKITKAISHPVLLGQCRRFLLENNLLWENWADTASAAMHVSQSDDPNISALSSPLAGEFYGLREIGSDVEDLKNNTTRFLVLSREADFVTPNPDVMTTFVFDVRNIPAALYKALGGFATNGVNMTKLESYMLGGQWSATRFYADIQGHPEDHSVKLAMDELKFYTEEVKILGVYSRDRVQGHS